MSFRSSLPLSFCIMFPSAVAWHFEHGWLVHAHVERRCSQWLSVHHLNQFCCISTCPYLMERNRKKKEGELGKQVATGQVGLSGRHLLLFGNWKVPAPRSPDKICGNHCTMIRFSTSPFPASAILENQQNQSSRVSKSDRIS